MKIIGIDLGTTNSVIAEYKRGDASTIEVDGRKTIPSVVYIKDGVRKIGHSAKPRLLTSPELCLSSTKREIGTDWLKNIEGTDYSPIEAATIILEYLKSQSPDIQDVVITIPAYFEEEQRKQTLEAAEKAGLNVLRLIPEPTAAAIRYGFDKEKDQTILVIDLGGGTFDVSLLEIRQNNFIVKAVDGNHKLGGDDFDMAIVEYINQWVEENLGKDIRSNKIAQQRIKEEAERVKIALSTTKKETFSLIEVEPGLSIEIEDFTRILFKELIEAHLNEIIKKTNSVIQESGLTIDDISRVVLVGGSCKHPLIQEAIHENFKAPYVSDDMDTAVAEGAAIVCASLKSLTDIIPQDVIAHSLGTAMLVNQPDKENVLTFIPILQKNSPYPTSGAVLGYPSELSQSKVSFKALRGESKNPEQNTNLGSVQVPIPEEAIGKYSTAVAVIFEFDANGILKLTGVQLKSDETNETTIKKLTDEAGKNDAYLAPKLLREAISKHGFITKQLEIKI